MEYTRKDRDHITTPASNSTRSQPTHGKQLDGTVIPKRPVYPIGTEYGGIWYQTSNVQPYLYLPPIETAFDDGVPHTSIDVLIAVRNETGDHFYLTGWFNYNVYEWQYYGINPQEYDQYTPYYWSFLPEQSPNGWQMSDNGSAGGNG